MDVIDYNGTAIDIDRTLADLDRIDCEESLYVFLQYAWPFMVATPFTPGWAIEAMCEHLEAVVDGDIRRLIINIPPRCTKSTVCSVAFPAWTWLQELKSSTSGPSVPFLHASYGYNLSLRDSVKCRRLIKSTWYQKMWGDRVQIIKEQDQKIRFRNSAGGERLITSIGSGVTGEGGNIIVIDDPNAADEVLSEAIIRTTNEEWWDGTMGTRLNDPKTGAFVVVQQRLGTQDLTGHILETEGEDWTHLMLPMEYEPQRSFETVIGWVDPREKDGELLWPERFGKDDIDKIAKRLGPWKAAGQMQQRPMPKGGGIIKRVWWQMWPPDGEPEGKDEKSRASEPNFDFVIASLDTAYTEKTENDPSAMTVWGIFSADVVAQRSKVVLPDSSIQEVARTFTTMNPKVLLRAAWAERLELHKLVNLVAKTCREYQVDMLLIEAKASGISVAQEIRRLFRSRNFSVQLIDPKSTDKMARLYSVQHIFEEGMVYAPNRKWADMVITEVEEFPRGAHDDLTDTTSQALRKLRDLGLLARSEEISEDLEEQMRHRGRPPGPLYPGSS